MSSAADSRDETARRVRRLVKYSLFVLVLIAIVVVPFILFGSSLEAWTFGLITPERSAPVIAIAGILLLVVDVLLPIPSTFVASGLGAMLGAPLGILATVIGLTAGCAVGFGLGRYLGHELAERELGLTDYNYLSNLLRRYGLPVLAVCRPVPVLAEASVIPAGIMGMRAGRVMLVTGLANLGFAGVYAGLGASAEGIWGFLAAFAASLALPGVALLVAKHVRKSHDETTHQGLDPRRVSLTLAYGPMPAFRDRLSAGQMADLANYVRSVFATNGDDLPKLGAEEVSRILR